MTFEALIVDDSRTARRIIEKSLSLSGVPFGKVYHAGHGGEALEVLAENWVDIIFSDINMPEMNGVELVDNLLADDLFRSIPIIMVSSEQSTQRAEELRDRGVEHYLKKPFRPEQVRDVVKDTLGWEDVQ